MTRNGQTFDEIRDCLALVHRGNGTAWTKPVGLGVGTMATAGARSEAEPHPSHSLPPAPPVHWITFVEFVLTFVSHVFGIRYHLIFLLRWAPCALDARTDDKWLVIVPFQQWSTRTASASSSNALTRRPTEWAGPSTCQTLECSIGVSSRADYRTTTRFAKGDCDCLTTTGEAIEDTIRSEADITLLFRGILIPSSPLRWTRQPLRPRPRPRWVCPSGMSLSRMWLVVFHRAVRRLRRSHGYQTEPRSFQSKEEVSHPIKRRNARAVRLVFNFAMQAFWSENPSHIQKQIGRKVSESFDLIHD